MNPLFDANSYHRQSIAAFQAMRGDGMRPYLQIWRGLQFFIDAILTF